jgi:phosphatidylserine/phosphatidylglycerophosphate/cardiolipin synthase-like enzyme
MCEHGTRDNDIVGEGEQTASVMRKEFFNLLQLCEQQVVNKPAANRAFVVSGETGHCSPFHEEAGLFANARLKVIVGGPEHGNNNPIVHQYVKRIYKAKKEICFANFQFNPIATIIQALIKKRTSPARPSIRLISNGTIGKSHATTCSSVLTSRANYKYVDTAYEFSTPKTQYHKKVALFDDLHTIIGSANLGPKSLRFDREMICDIKDERVASAMRQVLQEDVKRAMPVTRKVILKRKLWDNVVSSLLSFTANFV